MKISENFIKRQVAEKCVLVPTDKKYGNGLFTLNETAERIFDLLCDGKNPDEIVATLCNEYETDTETAKGFTDKFIAQLCEIGVVEND